MDHTSVPRTVSEHRNLPIEVEAEAGRIGAVGDVLLDNGGRAVRYPTGETCGWPGGRSLLNAPEAVTGVGAGLRVTLLVRVPLIRTEVEALPSVT